MSIAPPLSAVDSSDAGIVIFVDAIPKSDTWNRLHSFIHDNNMPAFEFVSPDETPWRNRDLTTFLTHTKWRQLVILDDFTKPRAVIFALQAIEKGFDVFISDPMIDSPEPARLVNLARLSIYGASPLTMGQLLAELTLERD